ncbi:MAG: methylenetetrahydrofolate reductase C-terminal domain-containing protein [Anaerolineales bacterium]|nr:MAG: methylenetetrahydrofolate reductase C-terminal domain-containing protein [Anaerolineales bacterium]
MGVRSSRRRLPAFYPSVRQRPLARLATGIERRVKRALFDCRMCGNCLLFDTAFTCPMSCPNGTRNGPCRGSSSDGCFVDPTSECTWLYIYQRAERRGNLERLLEVNAPLDGRRVGCETWLTAYELWRSQHPRPRLRDLITNRARPNAEWDAFWHKLRQPSWWQGDSQYHPPAYVQKISRLEAALGAHQFVVSAEVAPPMEPTGDRIAQVAASLKGYADTANFTDNPLGVPRMSGLACAIHSLKNGLEPVLQIQTRHRSRHDFQAEALGAVAVGVRNILCLSDDIGRLGPGPRPRPELSDIDAVQALWILRRLRDEGIDVDGEPVEHRPRYFLGAAASPCAALPKYEAIVTEKKINAGAQFLQTLPIFDRARFLEWMEALDKRNLLGKVFLMPSVAPLKSPRHARFMANDVPGVTIPSSIMARIEDAADPQEEGIQIALDLIAELKDTGGIHGLHILCPGQEEVVQRLVKETGLRAFVPRAGAFSGNGRHKSGNGRGRSASFNLSGSMDQSAFDLDYLSGKKPNRDWDI